MSPHGPAKWIVVVAALTFLVFAFAETGSFIVVGVVVASIATFLWYHATDRASPRCLKCGEAMKPTARWCKSCGSASWTQH